MKMNRRDLLKFAAGSVAGILFTPLPYKALDDAAIWTQNWPWIPQPGRGPVQTRFTTCSLCPAGCGIRARCIAGQPVGFAGVSNHPVSRGALCPTGLGGHHLPFHPARITRPVKRIGERVDTFEPADTEEIVALIAGAIGSSRSPGSVAILDQQPDRTISCYYRQLLAAIPSGVLLVPPGTESAAASAFSSMSSGPACAVEFDLEHARTIVSFSIPLLEGWGTPGTASALLTRRSSGALRIIQCEPRCSSTASLADQWLPLRPGTETALALGLASVLVNENLCDRQAAGKWTTDFSSAEYRSLLQRFSPEKAAEITGLAPEQIRRTAHALASGAPSVAVWGDNPGSGPLGREESLAIAGLNILLGCVNREGGIVSRREVPAVKAGSLAPAQALLDAAAGSVRVLILDAAENGHAIPWRQVQRVLAPEGALVVSLSPFNAGLARQAAYVLPSPVPFEQWSDVPSTVPLPAASFAVSAPLTVAPADVVEPIAVIEKLAGALGISLQRAGSGPTLEEDVKLRAQAIFETGRGTIFTPASASTIAIRELSSAEEFWSALAEGGCWVDAPSTEAQRSTFALLGRPDAGGKNLAQTTGSRLQASAEYPLTLLPFGWRTTAGGGQCSPLMTKIFQESSLRPSTNDAWVHPRTAADRGLIDGTTARIATPEGSLTVAVHTDLAVMPGVIQIAVGPECEALNGRKEPAGITAVVSGDSEGVWRVMRAKVAEA